MELRKICIHTLHDDGHWSARDTRAFFLNENIEAVFLDGEWIRQATIPLRGFPNAPYRPRQFWSEK